MTEQKNTTCTDTKIRVALLIDEFFGGAETAYGGYGYLARHYIAKYIPDASIEMDVLLGKGWIPHEAMTYHEDNITLYRLPADEQSASTWLSNKNYDIYLSIELTDNYVLSLEKNTNKRLVLWIQDPRPWYEWREINTVKLFPETCYWRTEIYELVHRLYQEQRVRFVTQGHFLKEKAIDLYRLNNEVPIDYLPNPIDIDSQYDIETYPKKNSICFLGRIESVKRGWLFCEIARALPEYEFFMLGQTFREKEQNSSIMTQYADIPNLHFVGHVEGEEKNTYLKDAKILINTSIHEALPISFLEALSYGVLLVSGRNPENLTSRFGIYVGQILGDGFDKVPLFTDAIRTIMNDEQHRHQLAREAIEYIHHIHNVPHFIQSLRTCIHEEYQAYRQIQETHPHAENNTNISTPTDHKTQTYDHRHYSRLKRAYTLAKLYSHFMPSRRLRHHYRDQKRLLRQELRSLRFLRKQHDC